jgi:hypothetical protein
MAGAQEKIDPIDEFVKYWYEKSEEIKNTPVSPEQRDEYFKDFNEHKRSFKVSISYFDPEMGVQKIPDGFFKFASLEEIFEDTKKSKYSYAEIHRKLDTITTSFHLAVMQGIEKYKENESTHQEEMMKNKKSFFDNSKFQFILNLFHIGK